MSEEEKASGISVEELTEKESLIKELVEREDTIQAKAESASKQQLKDNETAEDIRKTAMESLRETKKRNSAEGGASPKRCNMQNHGHWSTFCKRKQLLTAKLDNRSYVQNNKNKKVNSK